MILDKVTELTIAGVFALRFARYTDSRGYFCETFRRSQFHEPPLREIIGNAEFVQCNESRSRSGTIRGLHFQWNQQMGKMVRTLHGHMVDLAMDIRNDSPSFGKIIAWDMPEDLDFVNWIWIPPGIAHGNYFPMETRIEYLCSSEYNPSCEAGISPLAADIDWGLCEPRLKAQFDEIAATTELISAKDRNGLTLRAWREDQRSQAYDGMFCGAGGAA